MSKTTSRRAILAGAATLPALSLPAVAAPSSLTAELERLVAGYYEAGARWAPLMLAAHAKTDAAFPSDWGAMSEEDRRNQTKFLHAACIENGCDAAGKESSAFHEAIEDIEDEVSDAPARTIDDLWAKALVCLFRSAPIGAGDTEFTWEEPEYEALVRAVAEIAGRTAFLEAIEATFEARS